MSTLSPKVFGVVPRATSARQLLSAEFATPTTEQAQEVAALKPVRKKWAVLMPARLSWAMRERLDLR